MSAPTPPKAQSSSASSVARLLREGALPALRMLVRPSTLVQIPRRLREGLGPVQRMFVQAHNNKELARLLREQSPVTIFSSFARSGSTWLAYLLSDVLLQNQGIETSTELPVNPDRIILHYYAHLIVKRDMTTCTPGLLMRSHETIPMIQKSIGGDPIVRKARYHYLYRTPEDALVSTFHLYRREKYLHSEFSHDIDLFCIAFMAGWLEHVRSFLDAQDEGVDVYLVSYDEMLRQPEAVLSQTLNWLGIPYTEAMVARAHANMQFKKLQAREAKALKGKIPFSGGGYEKGLPYATQLRPEKVPFFRHGGAGSGKMELKPETLARIRSETKVLLDRANERLARQSPLRQESGGAASPASSVEPASRNGHSEAVAASTSH